jgi:D-galactarolactone cycloisomerase
MKIASVRILGQSLPMTLVEVVSDTGVIGIGGTDAPVEVIRPILERPPWRLSSLLLGQDPADVERLAESMFVATLGQGGLVVHAMGALDMALWDLRGKLAGRPLHQICGGAVRDQVMVYASATAFDLTHGLTAPLRFKSTERLAAEARARVREGFRAIKFGWGNHFAPEDEDRLAAIREAIGPAVRLMIDLGGPDYLEPGITPRLAAAIADMLGRFDVYFLEEPLPPWDAEGYEQLARLSNARIATGEMLCHGYEFDRLIDRRAVGVVQPDAYRIGLTQTLRVARRADAAGILCVPHSPWSALAVAAHVHAMATVSRGDMVEYPSPSLFEDTVRHGELVRINTGEVVEYPLCPVDGYIPLPQRPGLGVGGLSGAAVERMEALAAEGLER